MKTIRNHTVRVLFHYITQHQQSPLPPFVYSTLEQSTITTSWCIDRWASVAGPGFRAGMLREVSAVPGTGISSLAIWSRPAWERKPVHSVWTRDSARRRTARGNLGAGWRDADDHWRWHQVWSRRQQQWDETSRETGHCHGISALSFNLY